MLQVIWVDLLTKQEFEAGFGSHTPMFSGQTKCVRYYMNFERALRLMKEVIAQEGHTFDAHNKPGVMLNTLVLYSASLLGCFTGWGTASMHINVLSNRTGAPQPNHLCRKYQDHRDDHHHQYHHHLLYHHQHHHDHHHHQHHQEGHTLMPTTGQVCQKAQAASAYAHTHKMLQLW